MNYEKMGQRIRDERKLRRWSQAHLAEQVEVSVSFLGHIERGTRKASLETIVSIANSLHVSLDFLLADSLSNEAVPNSPYSSLSPRQRKTLHDILQFMCNDLAQWEETVNG